MEPPGSETEWRRNIIDAGEPRSTSALGRFGRGHREGWRLGALQRVRNSAAAHYISLMNLTDEETAFLVIRMKRAIADDHYPLSPRVQTEGILDRLDPRPA